jgi:CBS domain-containing protein
VDAAVTAGPSEAIRDAIRLMRERRAGCVIVVEHGRPIGIFSERDVLTKVLSDRVSADRPLADGMTRDPEVVEDGYSVSEVIRRMTGGGFRHMPVVVSGGFLCGVLSVKRIVEYLVEHFPASVFNLPPDPGQKQLAREGA